jgi:hypothetical protein
MSSLTFEPGSKLTRIEEYAFSDCSSLQSVFIPRSIRELSKNWVKSSSLQRVIFESALSLRVMIETGKVDLQEEFEIEFVDIDCSLDFPRYCVETVQNANNLFHLVKK